MPLREQKCNKCKCWRKKDDFKRRDKMWKSCNVCANFNKKYKMKPSASIDSNNPKTDTYNHNSTEKQANAESIITLVDLWPDFKDSTNNDAVKNNPKIKYTTLQDSPKGLEEVECKYHKIPSSFQFRIPDSDTLCMIKIFTKLKYDLLS